MLEQELIGHIIPNCRCPAPQCSSSVFSICCKLDFNKQLISARKPGAISGQRQSWKTPGEFEISKSLECDIFSLQCFDTVGWAIGRASGL